MDPLGHSYLIPGAAPVMPSGYIERFRRMADEGVDLEGEARWLDVMLARRSRVLDAGCGLGRVGAQLAAREHVEVSVDADRVLIAAAEADHPGPTWLVADLVLSDESTKQATRAS